jgi:transcriptional regulator with GAF, ATPase, and Fis domain
VERFNEILLDIWREASRHVAIGESTSAITRMLLAHMPLEQVCVRRLDRTKCGLETVAIGLTEPGHLLVGGRTECTAVQLEALMRWCRGGGVRHFCAAEGSGEAIEGILSAGMKRDLLAGPLMHESEPSGVLTFAARDGLRFEDRHASMMKELIEPFSVALENDHRLREMKALREAAEADKQSLLNRLGRRDLGDVIVGADSGLQSVMERVELVSKSDVPVLILGETGSGKELIARAIHRRSARATGPVIRVNCGAIPPELIDSQLFGHEKGAFTGAVETRKGWFERADRGTLFLDEIGELPLAAQVRLLRILQDGWLERIGGQRPISVDVRIVAASHRDLASMVAEGRFREDLWYRVAVFPIFLPPLRDRRQDIPRLARHFAERAAVRFGLPVLMPTEEDNALLCAYAWPGNVRELGTVLDRAAILGNGRCLEVAKALGVMHPVLESCAGVAPGSGASNAAHAFGPLDAAMRGHIETALVQTRGRIEGPHGAAVLLGINPHTLRARMRKLGIVWKDFRTTQ